MSQTTGTWGTFRWGRDAWGVRGCRFPVVAVAAPADPLTVYHQTVEQAYDCDRATVTVGGTDVTDSCCGYQISLGSDRACNSCRLDLDRSLSLTLATGLTEVVVSYGGITRFRGILADVSRPAGLKVVMQLTALSIDSRLAITACPAMTCQFYATYLITLALAQAGIAPAFVGFSDYWAARYTTVEEVAEIREVELSYAGYGPHYYQQQKTILQAASVTWDDYAFGDCRAALDTLANGLKRANCFLRPDGIMVVSDWDHGNTTGITVPLSAQTDQVEVEQLDQRWNMITLTCRDGGSFTREISSDIAAHGRRHLRDASTSIFNSTGTWAVTHADSIMQDSIAPGVLWETPINPLLWPIDIVTLAMEDGSTKTVKIESVTETMTVADGGGAWAAWKGKVLA